MDRYEVPQDRAANLADLVERAERGEEVVITREGKVVAEITPAKPSRSRAARPQPFDMDALNRLRARIKLTPANGPAIVREMRDEPDW